MTKYITLVLIALVCSMTPMERTLTLDHRNGADSTVTNAGGGYFLGAGHCAAHKVRLSVEGHELTTIDYNYVRDYSESDWAIFYCEDYIDVPYVEMGKIVPGETCWFWRNGKEYPLVFYSQNSHGDWTFYGQPPIDGISGTGVFNAEDEMVAIIVAGFDDFEHFTPVGLATATWGINENK